ncbi:phosphatase PAP2 family protein [Microlunatus sp. GCM10028923]|uniref:phosphatase PAP2 family protein n=1 Tax=Microlunatus sp. GCM10028923 TaxID=3273400 RepID=UPI0036100302
MTPAYPTRLSAALAGGTALIVMITAGLLLRGSAMPPLDLRLTDLLYAPPGTLTAQLAQLGSAVPLLVILIGLVIVCVRAARTDRPQFLRAAPRFLAVLAACPVLLLLQEIIARPGPVHQPNSTYPSGHAIVFGGLVAITAMIVAHRPSPLGRTVLLIDAVAVIIVCGSRMVLAEHYLSDLIGGLLGVTGIALLLGGTLGLIPPQRRPAAA